MTDRRQPRRPAAIWALVGLLLLQGISGLAGGISLVLGPKGEIMKMPVSYLEGSPFADYRVPGLILLLVLGVFPLAALVGLWLRRPCARYAAFAVGCGLMIWILVEVTILPFDMLQVIFGAVGALITMVTLPAPVRRYCGVSVLGG